MLNREIIVYINSNYGQIAEKDSISNVVIFRVFPEIVSRSVPSVLIKSCEIERLQFWDSLKKWHLLLVSKILSSYVATLRQMDKHCYAHTRETYYTLKVYLTRIVTIL